MTRLRDSAAGCPGLALFLALVVAPGDSATRADATNALDLTSIESVCVPPISAAAGPADLEFLQRSVEEMLQRVGYRVLENCADADSVVSTTFAGEEKKDFAGTTSSHRGYTNIAYVVLRLSLESRVNRGAWDVRFEQRDRPNRIRKIGQSLLKRAERKLRTARRQN